MRAGGFDKILVSEYKLFKRSNKANLFIALVQWPVSQMKMTFQEIRIIATCPCIVNHDSSQLSTRIYDKRDDFNFKIINFPNMCSNIPASPAYGKYFYVTHCQKKFLTFLTSLSLYIFTIWKCITYNFFCRDGIYFDKGPVAIILISWNVIFIWETSYWTRAMQRFALFDLLKSLYSDTKILSKYIPFLKKWWVESDFKALNPRSHYGSKVPAVTITVFKFSSFHHQ
jgi:hypothetical protein